MSTPNNLQVRTTENYLRMLNVKDDFRIHFVDMTRTVATSDETWEEHRQVCYEIILIYRGKYQCKLDDQAITLNPWDMLIVQQGQKHEDFFQKGCTLFGFHFYLIPQTDSESMTTLFDAETKPAQQVLHLEDRKFFLFLIRNLIGPASNRKDKSEYFYLDNAIFNVIFRKILLLYPPHVLHENISRQITDDYEISKLYSIFTKHLSDMPDLNELCQESGMSRSALHRLCQELFHLPPRKAFMHYKITQIQNFILKNPGLRVKEISEMFGFKNPFHFSRVFRQELGYYPNSLIKSPCIRRSGSENNGKKKISAGKD